MQVLSEIIINHVEDEENRSEGLFAQARDAGLDVDALGAKMRDEKHMLIETYKSKGAPKPPTPPFTGTKPA